MKTGDARRTLGIVINLGGLAVLVQHAASLLR